MRRTSVAVGAAFAVGIGYMDPGNWATDLDAARWQNTLLWAVIASGIAAALLQIVVVRFSAAAEIDLAAAIAQRWPRTAHFVWPVYAFGIIATEIAEFTGLVVGLQLLLAIPAAPALAIAAAMMIALLCVGPAGARRFERLAIVVTAFLALAYAVDWYLLRPSIGAIASGALTVSLPAPEAVLAVVGIVGATIMPHNLFLHSGLIHERLRGAGPPERATIEKGAVRQTVLALAIATAINASILIVGARVGATTIERAFATLLPVAGRGASTLFGLALCAAALAATATGVLAGDMVCGPQTPFPLRPLVRRTLAIAPAIALLAFGISPTALLIGSQVALGLILPAVVLPLLALVHARSLHRTRGGFVLVASSSAVAVAAITCDGLYLTSLIPRG